MYVLYILKLRKINKHLRNSGCVEYSITEEGTEPKKILHRWEKLLDARRVFRYQIKLDLRKLMSLHHFPCDFLWVIFNAIFFM